MVAAEAAAVAAAIDAAATQDMAPADALRAGSSAYLAAMRIAGRTRLLLIEAPAVLGGDEVAALDEAGAAGALREGLAAAIGDDADAPIGELAILLSAAFDRAALAIDRGADAAAIERAMALLLARVATPGRSASRRRDSRGRGARGGGR